MSLSALRSLLAELEGPEEDAEEASRPDIVVEQDDDLAGAIESWFEKGDEVDRRYGDVDSHPC
ncbi:MAG: hypothetical protein JRF63_08395 [Deltaproteobacteria bacterium]|nr:hypothetical protein [Deltaproteobacteria bacterium]